MKGEKIAMKVEENVQTNDNVYKFQDYVYIPNISMHVLWQGNSNMHEM